MMATMTTAMGMVMLIVICWIHSVHVDSKSCPERGCHRNVLHDRLELKLPWWCLTWRWRNMTELCAGCSWARWCLAIFGISWCAFFIRWFFILKQLVISIISFLQLKLSRSPRAAVSATRCLDFAFFSYFFAISTSPSQSLWRSRGRHHKPTHVLEDTTSSEGRLRCGRHLQIPAASWARALKKRLYTFLDFLNFLGWTVWVLLLTSSSNGYPKLSRCAGMNRSWEPERARMSQNEPETIQRPWARPSC